MSGRRLRAAMCDSAKRGRSTPSAATLVWNARRPPCNQCSPPPSVRAPSSPRTRSAGRRFCSACDRCHHRRSAPKLVEPALDSATGDPVAGSPADHGRCDSPSLWTGRIDHSCVRKPTFPCRRCGANAAFLRGYHRRQVNCESAAERGQRRSSAALLDPTDADKFAA